MFETMSMEIERLLSKVNKKCIFFVALMKIHLINLKFLCDFYFHSCQVSKN